MTQSWDRPRLRVISSIREKNKNGTEATECTTMNDSPIPMNLSNSIETQKHCLTESGAFVWTLYNRCACYNNTTHVKTEQEKKDPG